MVLGSHRIAEGHGRQDERHMFQMQDLGAAKGISRVLLRTRVWRKLVREYLVYTEVVRIRCRRTSHNKARD